MIKTAREILEMDTYTLQASGKYPLLIFQKNGNIWRVNVQHRKPAMALLEKLREETPFKLCGTHTGSKYYITTINGISKENHRWLWELFKGPIPEGNQIDHVDNKHTNHLDNRLDNLRLVTISQQRQNRSLTNNTSGYPGVYQHGVRQEWRASIRIPGGKRPEKAFKTKDQAIKCRKVMELFVNEKFNGIYPHNENVDLNAWEYKNLLFLEWKNRKIKGLKEYEEKERTWNMVTGYVIHENSQFPNNITFEMSRLLKSKRPRITFIENTMLSFNFTVAPDLPLKTILWLCWSRPTVRAGGEQAA